MLTEHTIKCKTRCLKDGWEFSQNSIYRVMLDGDGDFFVYDDYKRKVYDVFKVNSKKLEIVDYLQFAFTLR